MEEIKKIEEKEFLENGDINVKKFLEVINNRIMKLNRNTNEVNTKYLNLRSVIFDKIEKNFTQLNSDLNQAINSKFSEAKEKFIKELKDDLEEDEDEVKELKNKNNSK